MSSKQLRYYQIEAIDAVIDSLYNKKIINQLLVMCTGSGKSYTAVKIAKRINEIELAKDKNHNSRIIWQVHVEELLEQGAIALIAELELMPYNELISTIKNAGGLIELITKGNKDGVGLFSSLTENEKLISDTIGIIKADLFDINKPIVIASVQTLHRRLDKIPSDHFGIVIADEADLFGAVTLKRGLEHFTPKLRLGLTATPYRQDNMLIGDIFDEIVYDYPIDKAIKDKHLCQIDAIQIKTSADLDAVRTVAGEFNQKELVEKVNTLERNNLIISSYLEHANGRQFIAFCCDVAHAQDLCEQFNERGIKCNFVVGDKELTTDRRGIIESFKNGDLLGITNVMIFTAGFDHPDTGCIILACPTKSKRKFMQQLGRGTRLKSNSFVEKFKQDVILLDVVDLTTKHKLINTFTLDKDLPVEKKVFISEKNRQMLLDVKFKREHSFTTQQRLQDVKVDLFQLPKVTISESLRMKEPATEKQLAWIASLGYDVVGVHYTKLMCSEIISLQSASDKQIYALGKLGYDMSNGCTVTEAKLAFDEHRLREESKQLNQAVKDFKLPFNL